jgi:hypothetical protein
LGPEGILPVPHHHFAASKEGCPLASLSFRPENVDIEREHLYPMLKSSDVANGNTRATDRLMLVPQTIIGGDTHRLADTSPKTWAYLQKHASLLDRRGSNIYRNRPRFSIFGVGDYSFSPWKVAISGLYKSLNFRVVGPIAGRPTVLDDTINFIPCRTRKRRTSSRRS